MKPGKQFEGMLPGVDWNPYEPDEKYAGLPEHVRNEVTGLEKDTWRKEQYYKDFPHKNPQDYVETPYSSQQDELSRGLKKISKVITSHPFPENMTIKHTFNPGTWGNDHEVSLHTAKGEKVGSVEWRGDTGHVSWMGVDEPYRHLVPHLANAAHRLANAVGDLGPTHSETMSPFSNRVASNYTSSFIPEDATVGDFPKRVWDAGDAAKTSYNNLQRRLSSLAVNVKIAHDTRSYVSPEHEAASGNAVWAADDAETAVNIGDFYGAKDSLKNTIGHARTVLQHLSMAPQSEARDASVRNWKNVHSLATELHQDATTLNDL